MVAVQDFQLMVEALRAAGTELSTQAANAGPDAVVLTCPGWQVRDLVAHTGLVYRWASAYLTRSPRVDAEATIAAAHAAPDLIGWFDEGLAAITETLNQAPADLTAKFFLTDAPPARDAWLRRMLHETSIHALDAHSARLGRVPRSDELWPPAWLAADGVDEMLTGYVPRRSSTPAIDPGHRVGVSATDTGQHWLLTGTADAVVTTRSLHPTPADSTVSGTARQLYAALWNRGTEPVAEAGFWAQWRDRCQVLWG